MALTTAAKDWIAQKLGRDNCMTEISMQFQFHDSVNDIMYQDTGGTATILNALVDSACDYVVVDGTPYYASSLRSVNGGTDPVYPADVQWVQANDAGATQYCYTASGNGGGAPGSKTATPPLMVTIAEGVPCPAGAPTVVLDTTEAFAYFKASPTTYVGVMDVLVTNVNTGGNCYGYFAWEMRLWPGDPNAPVPATCPTGAPERQEISRFLGKVSATKVISVKLLGTSEQAMIGASFEIPTHMRGTKVLCLSLWGNHDKDALLAELAAAGYQEEIPW